jgi:hypothetical protein
MTVPFSRNLDLTMAAPSPTDALQSVMDIADILSGLLGTFEVSSVVSKPPPPPPPQPKSKKPPPLALPRTRTLHFPETKVKMSLAITEHLRTIYTAKIKQLRRVTQEEYTHLCRSLPGADFAKIGKLLRTSYRASEDRFAQHAIDACLDAHDLAVNPPTVRSYAPKCFKQTKKMSLGPDCASSEEAVQSSE